MKTKFFILLFFSVFIYGFNFSQAYAEDRFLFLGQSASLEAYLDTATLSVTKDDRKCIYYDAWLKSKNKQEVQQLDVFTNQQEYVDYELFHMIFAITQDKKMVQIRSVSPYGKSGAKLLGDRANNPMFTDIIKSSMADVLADEITRYVSQNWVGSIPDLDEKYLPLDETKFYNLFTSKGYLLNKIEESQGPKPANNDSYISVTTPYSFLDKALDKEVWFSASGEDKQHLNMAHVSFGTEGQNYKQSELFTNNLSLEEKLNLFYTTLQALFPEWSKDESEKWVNDSIARMNQSDKVMFIYLHKGKNYIMISRQPTNDNIAVLYVLKISPIEPIEVNPIQSYYERNNAISIYEEWKPSKKNS
jgi:hypothetical protein